MRLRRLPKNFHLIAKQVLPDLPASARTKLELISLVERLTVGSTVNDACRLVGVPRSTYYRWRAKLAGGVMALRDAAGGVSWFV